MQVANLDGRAHVMRNGLIFDVEHVSGGAFPADPQALYRDWQAFLAWGSELDWESLSDGEPVVLEQLGPPAPRPAQVFAVGLNYRSHAKEANLAIPATPVVFTKFPSCLAGPYADVPLPSDTIDWEVELVVVVGQQAQHVSESDAWSHIAGVSLGQDISDRTVQHQPPVPQFCMAKSFPAFGPFGPVLVTLDELGDPDNLELSCSINGDEVQRARTNDLIFSVPEIVAYLSSIVTLYPGDVIFTGTPSGVGGARDPKWFLRVGDVVESHMEGVGTLRNTCVADGRRLAMTSPIHEGSSE